MALNPDVWQANTSYSAGDKVRPSSANGFVYMALNSGMSGSAEPSWPQTQGAEVIDNEVHWVAINKRVEYSVLDKALEHIKQNGNQMTICLENPTHFYQACDPEEWQAETQYQEGEVVRPTSRNGFVYVCIQAGTSGTSEPSWPTAAGQTVSDGTVVWECYENFTLCAVEMTPSDYSIEFTNDGGRKITTATKTDVVVYREGEGKFACIVDTATGELLLVTVPNTSQNFIEGALARITEIVYEIELPS